MTFTYPEGAIKTKEELMALGKCTLFEASRNFKMVLVQPFTGRLLHSVETTPKPYEYWGFEVNSQTRASISLVDCHVGYEQTYNDWFVFSDPVKAYAYADKPLPKRITAMLKALKI